MKEIQLTQGKVALIDDDDFDFISQWKWHARRLGKSVYAYRTVHSKSDGRVFGIAMHRVLLSITEIPNIFCDHKDGNGLNNQRYNLRKSTKCQNNSNVSAKTGKMYSAFKGITLLKGKKESDVKYWIAQINSNNKRHYLGIFPYTKEGEIEAAKAYNNAANKLHGEFAKLNVL